MSHREGLNPERPKGDVGMNAETMRATRAPTWRGHDLDDGFEAVSTSVERQREAPHVRIFRFLVATRIVMAGALLCTVMVGAVYALATGNQLPVGYDVVTAIGGGVATVIAKLVASAV